MPISSKSSFKLPFPKVSEQLQSRCVENQSGSVGDLKFPSAAHESDSDGMTPTFLRTSDYLLKTISLFAHSFECEKLGCTWDWLKFMKRLVGILSGFLWVLSTNVWTFLISSVGAYSCHKWYIPLTLTQFPCLSDGSNSPLNGPLLFPHRSR